jgi:hypothetical protein
MAMYMVFFCFGDHAYHPVHFTITIIKGQRNQLRSTMPLLRVVGGVKITRVFRAHQTSPGALTE